MPATIPFNAGAVTYSDERRKQQELYQEAVRRAGFLSKRERENWLLIAYILDDKQLREARSVIINEDLKRMKTRKQLERIKPTTDK